MPDLPNFSAGQWAAIGLVAEVIMCAFPILVLVYGILFGLARRHQPLEAGTIRRGWIILGLCLAALVVGISTGFLVRRGGVTGYLIYGVVEIMLLVAAVQSALLLRQPLGRPLRFGSGALLTNTLFLVLLLPFTVWIAAVGQRVVAYSNFNEAEVRAALRKNPNDPAAHSSLAQIDSLHRDHAGAITEWRQVLAVEPDNEMALFMLGSELTRAHQPEQARPLYQKLAAQNGTFSGSARQWLARHGG